MVLGTIGIVFHLTSHLGLASTAVAATYALAILFLRAPLVAAVSAVPTMLAARVALRHIDSLHLAAADPGFPVPAPAPWHELRLTDVAYTYPGTGAAAPFTVGPLNLSVRRGDTLFVIGANGSGKSTLAQLLTGLAWQTSGTIAIDGQVLAPADRAHLRQRCAAVFTDFHVFQDLIGPGGATADATLRDTWLSHLQLRGKVPVAGNRLLDTRFSQGQRKRLALLQAVLEERDILLLDEWAADQDPHFRQHFYDVLLPALKAEGKTLIIISHDNAYFHHADHLWHMHEGRLTLLTGEQREAACRRPLSVEPPS
ncbi:ATP-binding cassette domain-containing protein [Verticiella alkaliphila]|uniref:ATP-binding cassette domain-containing protein n=1 Tax=Verticiella alkaliphila TaxID=2779529 RepID=UPI001C0CC660|nr:ATP-binding cassette domain-containing protein [Verticiella sp. GG226]